MPIASKNLLQQSCCIRQQAIGVHSPIHKTWVTLAPVRCLGVPAGQPTDPALRSVCVGGAVDYRFIEAGMSSASAGHCLPRKEDDDDAVEVFDGPVRAPKSLGLQGMCLCWRGLVQTGSRQSPPRIQFFFTGSCTSSAVDAPQVLLPPVCDVPKAPQVPTSFAEKEKPATGKEAA